MISFNNQNLSINPLKTAKIRKWALPILGAPFLFSCSPKLVPLTKDKIEWSENVKVMAAAPQRYQSFEFHDPKSLEPNSLYMKALLSKFKEGSYNSLEDANNDIVKNGYKLCQNSDYMAPAVETPRTLDVFNKNDTTKERFALLISGYDRKEFREEMFRGDCDKFKTFLKDEFKMPDENFSELHYSLMDKESHELDKSEEIFSKQLKAFAKKIKDSGRDLKDTELVMYYAGHGYKFRDREVPRKMYYEGADIGMTDFGSEYLLKDIIEENPVLKKIKILFLNDSCHSGAWIAEGAEKQLARLL